MGDREDIGPPTPVDAPRWLRRNPGAPTPGFDRALVFDPGQRALLTVSPSNDRGDLDAWILDGTAWRPGGASPTLTGLAADSASGTVLGVALPDVYVREADGWRVLPRGPESPRLRSRYALTYDASGERLVLFGGARGVRFYGDLWVHDGTGWHPERAATESGPSPRSGPTLVDLGSGELLLFGGIDLEHRHFGDLWRYDEDGWTELEPEGPRPPPRTGHAMAYDPVRDRVVMFGGCCTEESIERFGETWEWDGVRWEQVATDGPTPAPRQWHAMAFDAVRSEVVLLWGYDGENEIFDDAWSWDGERWEPLELAFGSPRTRQAAFIPEERAVVAWDFGAQIRWSWDGRRWSSAGLDAGAPGVARDPRVAGPAFDPARGRALFVASTRTEAVWAWQSGAWSGVPTERYRGGTRGRLAFDEAREHLVMFESTGAWILDGESWSRQVHPPRSWPQPVVWDRARSRMVTFDAEGTTWQWDGDAWSEQPHGEGGPDGREGAVLVYDERREEVVLVGGRRGPWSGYLNDVWAWDGEAWRLVVSGRGPQPRAFALGVYDAARDAIVLSGGTTSDGREVDDTWVLRRPAPD
jgi:hypothetical protein